MTAHIDLYAARGGVPGHWEYLNRLYEGDEAVAYAEGLGAQKGLPYFNGYTAETALHEDGECAAHRPEDPVWRPAKLTDIGGSQ